MATTVRIDFRDIDRFNAAISAALGGGGSKGGGSTVADPGGPIGDAFKQWAVRARGFWRLRFDRASKGDGTWKPLSPATLKARARRPLDRLREHRDAGFISERQYQKRYSRALGQYRKRVKAIDTGAAKASILRDTGTLFAALAPTLQVNPGGLQENIVGGVRVGYGGPHVHPGPDGGAKLSSSVTIADIAMFHDQGMGVPKREIIVMMSDAVVAAMAADLGRALQRLGRSGRK